MTFFLPGEPPRTTHHAKRIVRRGGFVGLADRPELVAAKARLDSLLLAHRPDAPLRGPVVLTVTFTFGFLASHAARARIGTPPKSTRPDLSNLVKTLEDRLVAFGFLEDDARVVRLVASKAFGAEPGIRVTLEPFEGGSS